MLREISKPVEKVDSKLRNFLDDMAETMYNADGIGLAAVQVGELIRAITIDCSQREEDENDRNDEEQEQGQRQGNGEQTQTKKRKKETLFLVNPEIVSLGSEMNVYREGCLSIPEFFAEIERPKTCVVEYLDKNGKQQTLKADGLLATCIQHEVDHLNGKLFVDHLSKLKRDMIIKKFKKNQDRKKSEQVI